MKVNLSPVIINPSVADVVVRGLSSEQKALPSWLFYDEIGDSIFQEIMRMPEYYPTRCEYSILEKYKGHLLELFSQKGSSFRLIELGAGDGLKTEILLKYFLDQKVQFTYVPVDISAHVLEQLSRRLNTKYPKLKVEPINASYDEGLEQIKKETERKVILFMGANIGNFSWVEAVRFLKKLENPLSKDDLVVVGFDLKKDPRIIYEAYDDPHGITERFNKNLLVRLNRELGANFNPDQFSHYPQYDPQTGTMSSYLISLRDQTVLLEALDISIHFKIWEPLKTEVSQKFDEAMIAKLLSGSDLRESKKFFDDNHYFCDVVMRKW